MQDHPKSHRILQKRSDLGDEMLPARCTAALLLLFGLQSCLLFVDSADGINWGTLSSHRMPVPVALELLETNRIPKVKLFEADRAVLRALMCCGIQVMVGIPNELLGALASSASACDQWVGQNVTRYRNGFGEMPIATGAVGWPTEGAPSAARDFNQGLVCHVLSNEVTTPLRPEVGDISCGCVGCGIFCSLWLIALWVLIYLRILNSS